MALHTGTVVGIDLLHAPYELGAQSITGRVAGTMQLSITGLPTALHELGSTK